MAPISETTTKPISKVLIANRGEIAVRIARACADSGIGSVAVYADPDRDALHVKVADEAYALGGVDPRRLLPRAGEAARGRPQVRRRRGAPRLRLPRRERLLRPGRHRRRADLDRPLPRGHRLPRRQGQGPPHRRPRPTPRWCPAPPTRSTDADEIVAFAKEHGLPVAIKAAYGGGGRGLKVARTIEEIPELFDSAIREAVAAFGRGECFVERYLDKPRHVETQCLADTHGNVVVVSTRDCSLQRRHQKLVEEAPAPFLSDEQNAELRPRLQGDPDRGRLHRRRHLRVPRRPGRHHLLPRGQHPPAGRAPGDRGGHRHRPGARAVPHRRRRGARLRRPRAGRPLLRVPDQRRGRRPRLPARPRRRRPCSSRRPARASALDSGVVAGDVIGGAFDSMLAKLIVTGRDRQQALERSRRALAEFVVDGMPTVLPFHRVDRVRPRVRAPRATSRSRCTPAGSRPSSTTRSSPTPASSREAPEETGERQSVVVEVGGKRLEVVAARRALARRRLAAPRRRRRPDAPAAPRPAPPRRATRSPPPCRAPSSRSPSRRASRSPPASSSSSSRR